MENDNGFSASTGSNNNQSIYVGSKLKKGALDAATSVWETLQYAKAFIFSQVS